jgi:TonB-dependent SusC/RagA subfamily outer membrane receptor
MQQAPVSSIDQAFAGRVAGVVITSNDGQPGAAPQITIRGGSVSQDNSPLFVIDGFPVENMDINSINPNDIESMDVLKDASSIAIYGARGANGVIIINTKRGIVSAPRVTYSFSTAVQQDVKRVKMMSPYQFAKLQLELATRFSRTYLDPA